MHNGVKQCSQHAQPCDHPPPGTHKRHSLKLLWPAHANCRSCIAASATQCCDSCTYKSCCLPRCQTNQKHPPATPSQCSSRASVDRYQSPSTSRPRRLLHVALPSGTVRDSTGCQHSQDVVLSLAAATHPPADNNAPMHHRRHSLLILCEEEGVANSWAYNKCTTATQDQHGSR
jgi:hypothetical protein